MRTTLLAATWGIVLLFGADHAFAEHLSSPFSKFCEAGNVNGAGTSTADGPTEPGAEKAQSKTNRPAEDVALSERLQSLIEKNSNSTCRACRTEPRLRRFIEDAISHRFG